MNTMTNILKMMKTEVLEGLGQKPPGRTEPHPPEKQLGAGPRSGGTGTHGVHEKEGSDMSRKEPMGSWISGWGTHYQETPSCLSSC